MKLQNNFKQQDRCLFSDSYECWVCGRNTRDAGHHIVGRGGPKSEVENSILNFAPVCNFTCHINIHGRLLTTKWKKKLLKKTHEYLINIGYTFTGKDKSFIVKYRDLYDN